METEEEITLAEYECCKCKHTWKQKPKMLSCRVCNWHLVKWVNYEEWAKLHNPDNNGEASQLSVAAVLKAVRSKVS